MREAGLPMAVNTQVNRLSAPHLSEIGAMLEAEGVLRWRLQLTVPMGRAADRPEWILEPWRMIEVLDTLAEIQREVAERGRAAGVPAAQLMSVRVSNNLGYYGPHEAALRSLPGRTQQFWAGCHAGQQVMGIESNGRIKGCPSLPTAPYVGGNIRDLSIGEIWEKTPELRFTRDRDSGELWGFCKSCYYAETCMAGCSFTAHCTMGRRGNNPFCYHRAATLKKQGKRERLVQVETAAGRPYDYGRFEIVQEAWVDGE